MPTIEASYCKKIGLRHFSSHSFSITVRTEVPTVADVEKESNQLYALLQETVDKNIQDEGYLPEATDNHSSPDPSRGNGNGTRNRSNPSNGDQFNCSLKQRDLVKKIIDEHRLDSRETEGLSDEMFRKPLKSLNTLEMSGLISELLEKHGPTKSNGGNGNGRSYQRGARR